MATRGERIVPIYIEDEMRNSYIDYSMSVIVSRALPDVRDGLKPVHRRVLVGMRDLNLVHDRPHRKSAKVTGDVHGNYHPHGPAAIYDTMVRMAQDFSMRYPLIDGQGNFGSIDGDSAAAERYTEVRLTRFAEELLADLDKETVDFEPNYDGTREIPVVLPSLAPNLLVNGSSGIAVGMATNIPPHNLRELAAAISFLIENYENIEDVQVEKLMEFISGPDFPTGGIIIGREGILHTYTTGKGRLVLRGMAAIEEMKGGRHQIVITEIPYQVNKTSLLERIAELAREDKIDQISDLRDESDQRGMSIVIELKRGAQPKKVLNQLYKYTTLQSTFGAQILALVDGEPRTLTLKRALHIFIDHRVEVITRRSQYELDKARARAHILDGLLIALANLDDVIQTIRQAADADDAKEKLVNRFKLTEIQAQAILDMQLRRLAALERWKIEEEARQVREQIAYLEDLLAHPRKILALIQADMQEIAEKYGDERRTRIAGEAKEELREEDLVQDEAVLITLTGRGYIKRTSATAYKSQGIGGKGVTGHTTKEEDEIQFIFPARTLQTVLFFSSKGKVYSEKVYQIPDADRTGKGISIYNVLSLEANEKITAALSVASFNSHGYCVLATTGGKIKRVDLEEFAAVRPSGLIAMTLENGDELGWARLTSGEDEILLVTQNGQALRFAEEEVRAMGRAAAGVQGIRLGKGDRVTSTEIVEPDGALLVVTDEGYGKRTPLKDYSAKGRATGGIATVDQKSLDKIGKIASARVVQPADDITVISTNGIVLRLKVKEIKEAGRATRGVRLMKPQAGDSVAAIARIANADLKSVGANGNGDGKPVEKEQPSLL